MTSLQKKPVAKSTMKGMYYTTRQCQEPCKKRRSGTQFDGDSNVCKQCVRRARA